ncbi:tyrosine-type recombinase/integrase [Paraburkholderia sp. EG286A]|uniref:tyrosine-type recombinase/integrase n=1 Tax=unclassified Paraburkholderia TaxID=2615204 RepID=UPI0034D32C23
MCDELGCQLRLHRHGFVLLTMTRENSSQVGHTLVALRHFYAFSIRRHLYPAPHPFERIQAAITSSAPEFPATDVPVMPAASGIEPAPPLRNRLTNTYYVRSNGLWVPRVIDDPDFPRQIFAAGAAVGWPLRDRLITRLLFETGARVSEICALTLADWLNRGGRTEASAFSKGSAGRRVKIVCFSETTAKWIRQYFDNDRRAVDPEHWRLTDYREHGDPQKWQRVPLFLTRLQTAMSPGAYRDQAWRPACLLKGIQANVHQARHWYVTTALTEIDAQAQDIAERDRRIRALIVYMGWRSGAATLAGYDHHLDRLRHAEIQVQLQEKLDRALRRPPTVPRDREATTIIWSQSPHDPDWRLLMRLGRPSNEPTVG